MIIYTYIILALHIFALGSVCAETNPTTKTPDERIRSMLIGTLMLLPIFGRVLGFW